MAKYRFVLVEGRHNEGGRTYKRGDIIETDNDLTKHNRADSIKFQAVGETVKPQTQELQLELMTVAQLKEYAASREIDLSDVTKRAEILEIIKAVDG